MSDLRIAGLPGAAHLALADGVVPLDPASAYTRRCWRGGPRSSAPAPGKYARIERERRFLPAGEQPAAARKIIGHYPAGTTLRLRCVRQPGGDQYKLTQKIPPRSPARSGADHQQLPVRGRAQPTGRRAARTASRQDRYSIPPLGIDVFDPPLHGLVTAEAEFGTDAEMLAFQPPGYIHAEITDDPRFTGGRLAVAPREDLISWLAQYGISPDDPDLNQRGSPATEPFRQFQYLTPPEKRLVTTRIYREAYENAGTAGGLLSEAAAERVADAEFGGDIEGGWR